MQLAELQNVANLGLVISLLTQVVKPWLPVEAIPGFAVVVGVSLAVLSVLADAHHDPASLGQAALTGLLAGTASVGLYQAQKPLKVLHPKVPTTSADSPDGL